MKVKIIGVDMDKTLCYGVSWTAKECLAAKPNKRIIKIVNKLAEKHNIIIYTCRCDKLIPATLQWLRKHNVKYSAISNNKTACHYYIDDRNMFVDQLKTHYLEDICEG